MARLEVTTEVTGNVWKIEVNAGDNLAAEDVIMILESMKMEIPVEAPSAGKLVEILVQEEDIGQFGILHPGCQWNRGTGSQGSDGHQENYNQAGPGYFHHACARRGKEDPVRTGRTFGWRIVAKSGSSTQGMFWQGAIIESLASPIADRGGPGK